MRFLKFIAILFIIIITVFSCRSVDDLGVLVPPTVEQDASLPSVQINVAGHNRLIHVRTFGEKTN